jgi:hypothetical protein
MSTTAVQTALLWQSDYCRASGAPLSGEVLRLMAQDAEVATAFAPVFAPYADLTPQAILTAAIPLRALGALHFIVLTEPSSALATCYAEGGGPRLGSALIEALQTNPDVFTRFMASPPQTNEVRRSLGLFGGFLTVAAETGLPLCCLEIGASAGLNQNWDRFHYDLGEHGQWGDPASPVRLSGEWSGGSPPLHIKAVVVERAACDQNPIDIRDEAAALGLLAYVWIDQPERLVRARAAIGVARHVGVHLEKADAADWTARRAKPKPGVATVLYHSVFWQYPPEETRAAIQQAIEAAGASATSAAPFAWLRMEPDPDNPTGRMAVRLTLWPGGEDRLLARVNSHGATVEWLAGTGFDA